MVTTNKARDKAASSSVMRNKIRNRIHAWHMGASGMEESSGFLQMNKKLIKRVLASKLHHLHS